jgi:hypothetical protein
MAAASKSDLSNEQLVQAHKSGTSFELSVFQSSTIKQTSNMWVYKPQIHIVNYDHIIAITRLGTLIIMRGSKRSNLRKSTFNLKIQLFIFTKNHAKQLVLIAKGILKLDDSKGKTLGEWIITYIRVGFRDVLQRLAHETKTGEVACLALEFLILLWAKGVITGEVKVVEGSIRSRHHQKLRPEKIEQTLNQMSQ